MSSSETKKGFNFSAGPGVLPTWALEEGAKALLNYGGTGHGIVELSHRDKPIVDMMAGAEQKLRSLLRIPDDYEVLFLQGGATTQFSAIPLNLLPVLPTEAESSPVYLTTGSWSQAAVKEAKRYAAATTVVSLDSSASEQPTPTHPYFYYCDNETVHGVELPGLPTEQVGQTSVLVADMSSNFLSRPVDVSRFGVIYAGAQKNSGIAGLTIVIVRKDLLQRAHPLTPEMLSWKTAAAHKSSYNTPPVFAIYMSYLVFEWTITEGGVEEMQRRSEAKSSLLYQAIDDSKAFSCTVPKHLRSRMNVVFRVVDSNTGEPSGALEDQFVREAAAAGLTSLKGHRSVGGLRASLYNAMPFEGVQALVTFMKEFEQKL